MTTELLTPNHRLLLSAVSTAEVEPGRIERILEDPRFQWIELARLARLNRLTSFVSRLLHDPRIASHVDDTTLDEWRELQNEQIQRLEFKLGQLREIGEILAHEGLRALVYKGPDFHERYYSPSCPRAFNDLDIILHRSDVEAAARALEAAGYRQPPDTPPLAYYLRFHLHAIYLNPENRHPVEIHWAVDSPYSRLGDLQPAIFEAAEPGPVFGPAWLRPSPIDALALMVMHLEKHLGLCATLGDADRRLEAVIDEGGVFWVLDVLLWLGGTEAEGNEVLERARRLSAERSLIVALRLARDIDPEALPPWATELADRLPHRQPIAARVLYPSIREPYRSFARRWLFMTLPVLAFRPARIVEALLPGPRIPGVSPEPKHAQLEGAVSRVGLAIANVIALVRWKLGGHEREGSGRDAFRADSSTGTPDPRRGGNAGGRRGRAVALTVLSILLLSGVVARFLQLSEVGIAGSDAVYLTSLAKEWSEGNLVYRLEEGRRYYRPFVLLLFGTAIKAFGYTDYTIKMLNASVDTLNIGLLFLITYLMARRNPWVAFSAAIPYAFLPMAIHMARVELTHAISTATVLSSFLFFVFYSESRGRTRHVYIALAGLFAGLASMSHDELVFVIPGYLLFLGLQFLLDRRSRRRVFWDGALFLGISLLACHRLLIADRRAAASFGAMEYASSPLERVFGYFERVLRFPWNSIIAVSSIVVLYLVLLVIAGTIVFLIRERRRRRSRPEPSAVPSLYYLPALLIVTYFALYSYFFSHYYSRMFLPFLPLVLCSLAIWGSLLLGRHAAPILLSAAFLVIPFNIAQYAHFGTVNEADFSRSWASPARVEDDVRTGLDTLIRTRYRKTWVRERWDELKDKVSEESRLLVTSTLIDSRPGRRKLQMDYYFGDNAVYIIDHTEPLDEVIRDKNIKYVLYTRRGIRKPLEAQETHRRYLYDGRWEKAPLILGQSYGFKEGSYSLRREYRAVRHLLSQLGAQPIKIRGRLGQAVDERSPMKRLDYILFEL